MMWPAGFFTVMSFISSAPDAALDSPRHSKTPHDRTPTTLGIATMRASWVRGEHPTNHCTPLRKPVELGKHLVLSPDSPSGLHKQRKNEPPLRIAFAMRIDDARSRTPPLYAGGIG